MKPPASTFAATVPPLDVIKGELQKNLAERRLLRRLYRVAQDRELELSRLNPTPKTTAEVATA